MMLALVLMLWTCFVRTESFRGSHAPRVIHSKLYNCGADDAEVAKLFNRMADKYLLLDVPGAGTPEMINCCHGGCDNCDFSRIFDEMSSGRVKWVALYPFRKHPDGREHTPPWMSMFENELERLNKDQFMDRLTALPCVGFSMGPPCSVQPNEPPSKEILESFWNSLQQHCGSCGALTANDMALALARGSGSEHGALYSEFKRIVDP